MKTVLYARTSTKGQTIAHQLSQAEAAGFKIDEAVYDEGESGVRLSLKERPQGRRLFDMLREGDTLVVRWLDRLGRNYQDVCDNMRMFMRQGVTVRTVIQGMTFDGATKDPMQQAVRDALIGFLAALAQAQAEATREAQIAGIAHARTGDGAKSKYRGRKPSYDRVQFDLVLGMFVKGDGASVIARAAGLTVQTVLRIRNNPAAAEAALKAWGL